VSRPRISRRTEDLLFLRDRVVLELFYAPLLRFDRLPSELAENRRAFRSWVRSHGLTDTQALAVCRKYQDITYWGAWNGYGHAPSPPPLDSKLLRDLVSAVRGSSCG
jgi:hypothetical protein